MSALWLFAGVMQAGAMVLYAQDRKWRFALLYLTLVVQSIVLWRVT